MIVFKVEDMSCGHCVSKISKSLKSLDAGIRIDIDLKTQLVRIAARTHDLEDLADAIKDSGYTPTAISQASADKH